MIRPDDWRAPSGKFYPLTREVVERLDITKEMLNRYVPQLQCPGPEAQIEEILFHISKGWTMCWCIHRAPPMVMVGYQIYTRQQATPTTFMIAG